MKQILFILLQYLLPQHTLSRTVGWFAQSEIPWLKNFLIQQFAKHFAVDMTEAMEPELTNYASFNEFFCRPLKTEARPIQRDDTCLLCPADGTISQLGTIDGQTIFQAKGKSFSLSALLGGDEPLAETLNGGSFCTIYLSPKDYHRVHMPLSGNLLQMTHVPGDLFSVNPTTVNSVDNLFARNERVVSVFDTAVGPVAVILVGAMIVASIETVWAGEVAPRGSKSSHFHYQQQKEIHLDQGDEIGRFKLGSTVVLVLPPGAVAWQDVHSGDDVKMGQALGLCRH